jgi:ribose transport system permease protein
MTATRERQPGDAAPAEHRPLRPAPTTEATADQAGGSRSGARRALLGFRNISAVYVFVVLFTVFAMWVPETFLASTTWRTLLDNGSITALLAVGLVLPLASGVFDLALGAELGLGAILVAWFLVGKDLAPPIAVILTLSIGGLVGLANALLIVRAKVDSFIATLGMSSILAALITSVSGGQQILDLGAGFQRLGLSSVLGLTSGFWIMILVAVVVSYFLEFTPAGRLVYATGGNIEAARLAGVRTSLVIVTCLVVNGVVASFCGVLVSSRLSTGDPTIGPSYLLPAIAAAFLGSTQFRGGRYNVWGTVVAVYVLATGVKGLQLAGAPVWTPDMFNGLALLVAVAGAKYQRSPGRLSAVRKTLRMGRQ